MKRIISSILCLSLLATIICIPVSATEETVVTDNIKEFSNEIIEIITEYDSNKEFVVSSSENTAAPISDPTIWTPNYKNIESDETTEDTTLNFQTCRLIVQQEKGFDDLNAVAVADGFDDYHVVQFENESDTEKAYYEYLENQNVEFVGVDSIMNIETNASTAIQSETVTATDVYNNWYTYSTGIQELLDKKNEDFKNLGEIKIALLDTGINYEHEFFADCQDRFIKTGFNAFDENSDESDDSRGHGTSVASVIIANTPSNIKIQTYKVLSDDNGHSTLTGLVAAFLKAFSNGCTIFNCSFTVGGMSQEAFVPLEEVMKMLYKNGCFISVAAGNNSTHMLSGYYFTTSKYAFCVGGSTKYNIPYQGTNYGNAVKLLAPAKDIPVASAKGGYKLVDGTSFAAPFVCSVYATIDLLYPDLSLTEKERMITGTAVSHNTPYSTGYFGSGIINALNVLDMIEINSPEINVISPSEDYGTEKYVGPVKVEIISNDDCDIYYTLDDTYPSKDNGILYTEPFTIEDGYCRVTAVAFNKEGRSLFVNKVIHSATEGTDDMFTINDKGIITNYTGNVNYLKIPEKINGIKVVDIAPNSFSNATFCGVILPDTVTSLGLYNDDYYIYVEDEGYAFEYYYSGAFEGCKFLEQITGRNLQEIYGNAFYSTVNMQLMEFPNLQILGRMALNHCRVWGVTFPELKKIEKFSDENECSIFMREFIASKATLIEAGSFYDARLLTRLEIPNVTVPQYEYVNANINNQFDNALSNCWVLDCLKLDKLQDVAAYSKNNTDGRSFFRSGISRLEFSSVNYIGSLPGNYKIGTSRLRAKDKDFVLVLPSTVTNFDDERIFRDFDEEYFDYTNYIIYGTADSVAQQWANSHSFTFVELDSSNAVVEDVSQFYDRYSQNQIYFDCYGFNKSYQWYGSYTNGTQNGIELKGATSEAFCPEDFEYFPYYYCVMTSTDKNSDGETVKSFKAYSSVCKNQLYYMYAKDKTEIDFDNKLIYTKTTGCKDFLNIVGVQENTSYSSLPSLVYKQYSWYGTGSEFVVYNGTQKERYTLIVEGDVDGDSAVDVLDAYEVSLVANGFSTLENEYFLAADTNSDQEITVEDYAQVVNLVLAG